MSNLTYVVMDDNDTIRPTYPCGKLGDPVLVSNHGPNVATNKLIDNSQKHMKTCAGCNELNNPEMADLVKTEEKMFRDIKFKISMELMAAQSPNVIDVLDKMRPIGSRAERYFQELRELFGDTHIAAKTHTQALFDYNVGLGEAYPDPIVDEIQQFNFDRAVANDLYCIIDENNKSN